MKSRKTEKLKFSKTDRWTIGKQQFSLRKLLFTLGLICVVFAMVADYASYRRDVNKFEILAGFGGLPNRRISTYWPLRWLLALKWGVWPREQKAVDGILFYEKPFPASRRIEIDNEDIKLIAATINSVDTVKYVALDSNFSKSQRKELKSLLGSNIEVVNLE